MSKMTFYKFFPNKITLAKTVLERVIGESLTKYGNIMNGNFPFHEKVEHLFKLKLEASKDISVELLADIYNNPDSELRQLMEETSQKSQGLFVDFLIDSQSKGLIRKEIKIDFILHHISLTQQTMQDKQLLSQYDHPHELIMESMNFLFYGLMPKK